MNISKAVSRLPKLALHGWVGFALIIAFWFINWGLEGLRTYWGFFPLWLGYCLLMDALVLRRKGSSLLTRNPWRYTGLFLFSALAWWIFELFNAHTGNWVYQGVEGFTKLAYSFWATLSFTTVAPAVFSTAELVSTFPFVQRFVGGPVIRTNQKTTLFFFTAGWIMLFCLLLWPKLFFPFVWLSVFFIIEPVNVWLGNRTLAKYTSDGDWRLVMSIWIGVLITGFFWEMWNFLSYPKWVYVIPYANWFHLFEMPLLGYGGYLPFGMELFSLYHLIIGLLGRKNDEYVLPTIPSSTTDVKLV